VTGVRPRRLVHRGTLQVVALAFDEALLGEREAQRRVLDQWEPGARVLRDGRKLLLVWPRGRRLAAASAAGAPVVRQGSVLTSAPLDAGELLALAATEETFVHARGGALEAMALGAAPIEDPSRWLDTDDWALVSGEPLGDTPAARVHDPPVAGDARAVLRDIPRAAAERDELLALLRRGDGKGKGGGGPAYSARAAVLARVATAIAALAAWWRSSSARASSIPALAARSSGARGGSGRIRPAAIERARAWLQRVAARVLVALRLASWVGAEQSRYFRRMLAFFEQGDLDEALRHAIPIDGKLDDDALLAPALTAPRPRGDLSIHAHQTLATSIVGLGPDLQDLLRRTYRVAHQRLAAAGRIQEAAFVLTELLHANEEAVSFLEKHGERRLAAELAEARGLPPGLVIRQWFLAGDTARAVAVARRTGAFADAVERLERSRSPHAAAIRVMWAKTLASAGAYAAAVDAALPVPEARGLAREWAHRAIEAGGPDAARMLLRLAALDGDASALVREKALAILNDHHPAAWTIRAALANAIVDAKDRVPLLPVLARVAVRSLLAAPLPGSDATRRLIARLLGTANDGALGADLPALEDTAPLPLAVRTSALSVSLPARGPVAVSALAAAPLPDGRVLVALGERGARVLSRDGRTIAHFDQPAHALVVSDRGDRAILVAPRGRDTYRLSRVDVGRRRSQPWCDARMIAWAPDFDGSAWLVADDRGYALADAIADAWSALARVDVVDEDRPAWISRNTRSGCAVAASFGVEVLRFDMPGLVLRERRAVALNERELLLGGASAPAGRLALIVLDRPEGEPPKDEPPAYKCSLRVADRERAFVDRPWLLRPSAGSFAAGLAMTDEWLATREPGDEGSIEIALLDSRALRERLRLRLGGATFASMSFGLDQLCVADDQGRIVVVDLEYGGTRFFDMVP
jgi:MoxR-vWA-beta-propeller ternary system domain bpX6